MYSKLMRFFDDIHRLANAAMIQKEVTLSDAQFEALIDAFVNFRRRKPKKETV